MSLLRVTLTGFLASHFKRMASQCRSLFNLFVCGGMAKHHSLCNVCVVVVFWLLCMYENNCVWRLSHWFNNSSKCRCVKCSAETSHAHLTFQKLEVKSKTLHFFLKCIKSKWTELKSCITLQDILVVCSSTCTDFFFLPYLWAHKQWKQAGCVQQWTSWWHWNAPRKLFGWLCLCAAQDTGQLLVDAFNNYTACRPFRNGSKCA